MIRFGAKGWIEELYVQPNFFFKYYGFGWVQPLGGYTKWLFILCGTSALFFALGLYYRVSAVLLFLSFTYIELMDKTNYLNHYYFVSLVLFLMMWLPANATLALDNIRKKNTVFTELPLWTIGCLRLLLGIVYVCAGLAKLNSDWLFEAMPLRIWLPAKNDLALIGPLLDELWVAYLFSWFGACYDLTVPFFLLFKKTRPFAYLFVIIFHISTSLLFPIGMFPYVMILATVIFFPTATVQRFMDRWFVGKHTARDKATFYAPPPTYKRALTLIMILFFSLQLIIPWRYLAYTGELFWTEEGYRFSWRVMLMEKMGYAQFIVKDTATGASIGINNSEFLTANQEKMMATQTDFIIQYAHYLHKHFQQAGMKDPQVYATIYVTLNGRASRLFIDPNVNLSKEKDDLTPKKWVLPFNDIIYGL